METTWLNYRVVDVYLVVLVLLWMIVLLDLLWSRPQANQDDKALTSGVQFVATGGLRSSVHFVSLTNTGTEIPRPNLFQTTGGGIEFSGAQAVLTLDKSSVAGHCVFTIPADLNKREGRRVNPASANSQFDTDRSGVLGHGVNTQIAL
jgi:hypothetical protein